MRGETEQSRAVDEKGERQRWRQSDLPLVLNSVSSSTLCGDCGEEKRIITRPSAEGGALVPPLEGTREIDPHVLSVERVVLSQLAMPQSKVDHAADRARGVGSTSVRCVRMEDHDVLKG
jgi:hypothetical protein